MQELPHDISDILLAPVALKLDQQLVQLGGLESREIMFLVALETDREPRTLEQRRSLLLEALGRDVETQGWELTWDPRGLRLGHAGRHLVLGLPASVHEFVTSG